MSKLINYRTRLCAGAVLPLAAVAALAAGDVSAALAKGGSYEVLYNFAGQPNDGSLPEANLMKDKSGNLYGTTFKGGAANQGTVFKITTRGAETVLYSFQNSPDGAQPADGTLIEDGKGDLYGTSEFGGLYESGTVFKLAPNGTETILYDFDYNAYPAGGLISDSKGNLYGTTEFNGAYTNCGSYYGCGTVFELAPDGTMTILHSFGSGADGYWPLSGLLSAAGNLYGTTPNGGSGGACTYGCGTIFELVKGKKGAWTENVLHSFTGGSDGGDPWSDLISDSAGNLYGTATVGGANGYGDVFKLAPDGTFTVLYSFQGGSDGANPYSALLLAKNGDLYGTTSGADSGWGTVFKLKTDGTETVLHAFAGPPNDGNEPLGAGTLTDIGGYLYGTTYKGGTNNLGIVFKIKE